MMAELRKVCPLTLKPNPHNPRITPPPAAMDDQLLSSIKAIGIIHHPSSSRRTASSSSRQGPAAFALRLRPASRP
jgi:hypothetical protein